MECTSAAEAAVCWAALSQRRRRCSTQRQEAFRSLPTWNKARMAEKRNCARGGYPTLISCHCPITTEAARLPRFLEEPALSQAEGWATRASTPSYSAPSPLGAHPIEGTSTQAPDTRRPWYPPFASSGQALRLGSGQARQKSRSMGQSPL